jgi:hypothetical protein
MDKKLFFEVAKSAVFGGKPLNQGQVNGCEILLDACQRHRMPTNDVAYILATAHWETGGTMLPVIETRTAKDKTNPSVDTAIRRLNASFKAGKLKWVKTPYWRKDADGKSWLGRGYPQLTHKTNYEKASKIVGVDLVANPERMLEPEIAAEVMVVSMRDGGFTGKKLRDFIDLSDDSDAIDRREYLKARAIVNGKDRASEIADLAIGYERALRASGYDVPDPVKVYTDKFHVQLVQARLAELGYNTGSQRKDGTFDGVLGDLTKAAILASKNENKFEPLDDQITDAYVAALDNFQKRQLPREDLTPTEVRERAPEVQTNYFQKVIGGLTAVGAAIGGAYNAIMDSLGEVRKYVEPLVSSVPWYVWVGAAGAFGGFMFYQGRKGEKAGIEAFKAGGR